MIACATLNYHSCLVFLLMLDSPVKIRLRDVWAHTGVTCTSFPYTTESHVQSSTDIFFCFFNFTITLSLQLSVNVPERNSISP